MNTNLEPVNSRKELSFCGHESLSDRSKGWDKNFSNEPSPLPLSMEQSLVCPGQGSAADLDSIFMRLEDDILTFVKEQLQNYYQVLASDCSESLESEKDDKQSSREALLKITLDFLRRMKQEQLAERLSSSSLRVCRDELKKHVQQKFSCAFEGVSRFGNPTLLNQIYTELFVTEGGDAGVNQEHEVRHIETFSRNLSVSENTISCEDIFKGSQYLEDPITADLSQGPIKTVLTKGVAGIGKTVLTQKFSLDWAEDRANQDIQLLFTFTFRELNVLRDTEYSLVGLLHHFFSKTSGISSFQQHQVLFIFDGLDECRLPLDFSRTRVLTDPTVSVSVDVLLVNLIRGNLLPSAHLWITTRPAAANQIPAEYISMVTEVRGFADPQKEQYFRKRLKDKRQVAAVISHIKTCRSLYIMCHMPIFCWILSTVLLSLMGRGNIDKLPKTLTQMYVHFLVVQAKVRNKYNDRSVTDSPWTPATIDMVQTLGKLAFEQLQKGNLVFYECDLRESGLSAAAASLYSGVFTQVFKEEPGLYQNKLYCFVHLSVQEFLAALYVHQTFFSSRKNLLSTPHSSVSIESEAAFYRSAVERALQSPNGHFDLFLRFLLGLSLETNQSLLEGLLTQTRSRSETNQDTVEYIKKKLNEGISTERSLNLLHCLNELNNPSLMEEIQKIMREGCFSGRSLSRAEWSAMAFLLLTSEQDLEEFDLRQYQASETALLNLLPVAKASTKVILSGCGLSQHCCGSLALVLSSSSVTHLDLSNNDLGDAGVELLCSGLKSAPCKLETLRLSGCLVSERGGVSLTSALSSSLSRLSELDLSYNHPGPSAKLLIALQDDPHCPIESLRLDPAGERWMIPGLSKYSCKLDLDPNSAHRELILLENGRAVRHVKQEQQYPQHEDRFTDRTQVLSRTGLTGRCYWEVDWKKGAVIAVSYRGISRKGANWDCVFGLNDQSWVLRIFEERYSVCHNKKETQLPSASSGSDRAGVSSGRVAVFLDTEAGSLSFFKVSGEELCHLYTFSCSITEPLFPGFRLGSGSEVCLV